MTNKMRYQFELSESQLERYDRWKESLPKLDSGHFGAAGGGYWFKFIPTGIGTIVKVGRDDCPENDLDLTDWDGF